MSLAPDRSQLSRVLESEIMDSLDEARDYDAMDHQKVNALFVADLLAAMQRAGVPADGHVLDLGTGTAQIPVELCSQNSAARITAVDMAQTMLAIARQNVDRRGFSRRVSLAREDAKRLSHSDGSFAIVMSNSIVHHIPEPIAVLAEALRVVAKPGGLLFIRDLARPADDAHLEHLVSRYAAGANRHQRQLFEASLRAALSIEEIRELVTELGFGPGDVRPTSDRHWTWSTVI